MVLLGNGGGTHFFVRGASLKTREEIRAVSIAPGKTSLIAPIHKSPETAVHSSLVPREWTRKTGRCSSMLESFYHAFHGMFVALKEQRNLRIHLVIGAAVVATGIYLRVDLYSWFALAFSIGMVLTAELVNTAIEHAVDLSAEGEFHPAARLAKDTAAAAVLIASLTALTVGLLVFVPKILPIAQAFLPH